MPKKRGLASAVSRGGGGDIISTGKGNKAFNKSKTRLALSQAFKFYSQNAKNHDVNSITGSHQTVNMFHHNLQVKCIRMRTIYHCKFRHKFFLTDQVKSAPNRVLPGEIDHKNEIKNKISMSSYSSTTLAFVQFDNMQTHISAVHL